MILDQIIFSRYSCLYFCIIFFGYIIETSILQYIFYYSRSTNKEIKSWKIQSNNGNDSIGNLWLFPLLSNKPNRGTNHWLIATLNLFIASCFAFFTAEFSVRGLNKMKFDSINEYGLIQVILNLITAVTSQSIIEYYWHRMMHLPFFYKNFHKIHHYYKSPEPWDDMYIHPIEAFGYYCILYSPPFIFNTHIISFLIYMMIMGICGVLDHSGIKFSFPLLYNTEDHDKHHSKFEVNYSFPFPFMDIIHGTYDGFFMGKVYKCNKIK